MTVKEREGREERGEERGGREERGGGEEKQNMKVVRSHLLVLIS